MRIEDHFANLRRYPKVTMFDRPDAAEACMNALIREGGGKTVYAVVELRAVSASPISLYLIAMYKGADAEFVDYWSEEE